MESTYSRSAAPSSQRCFAMCGVHHVTFVTSMPCLNFAVSLSWPLIQDMMDALPLLGMRL
jgi:hypothetical protein